MANEPRSNSPHAGKALRVSLTTSTTLALVLAVGPVPYDADHGMFRYPSAHADSSCFLPGTRVRMADGRSKPIEEVLEGEWVMGLGGQPNRVVGIERVSLSRRRLYGFNGSEAFVTSEHPFWTPQGWKSIEPDMTTRENSELPVSTLRVGDQLTIWAETRERSDGNAALQNELQPAIEFVDLVRIDAIEAAHDTVVLNLLLDGDHTYFANGYAVHNKGGEGGSEGAEGGDDSDESAERGEPGDSEDDGNDDSNAQYEEGARGDRENAARGRGRGSHASRADRGGASRSASGLVGDLSPEGRDLSTSEEATAISSGWK